MIDALLDWQFEAVPRAHRCAEAVKVAHDRIAAHGDAAAWNHALECLPDSEVAEYCLGDCVSIGLPSVQAEALRAALMQLHPWRKGPFAFGELRIDAEWRSYLKWRRLVPLHPVFKGARVLDVGSGNGYYGWRMIESGARCVLGVDRNPLCTAQHLAVQRYLRDVGNLVFPLDLAQLPESWGEFDVVVSLGVLSHTREPAAHLENLFARLKQGGRVIVESLVLGEGGGEMRVADRYARMRNIWRLPSARRLMAWIGERGFVEIELHSVAATQSNEQRSTDWMRFESLPEALDKDDRTRTVEGLPAPRRALVSAKRP